MISLSHLVRQVKELGFHWQGMAKSRKTEEWKRFGEPPVYINLPRRDTVPDVQVSNILRQAGMNQIDITAFIKKYEPKPEDGVGPN